MQFIAISSSDENIQEEYTQSMYVFLSTTSARFHKSKIRATSNGIILNRLIPKSKYRTGFGVHIYLYNVKAVKKNTCSINLQTICIYMLTIYILYKTNDLGTDIYIYVYIYMYMYMSVQHVNYTNTLSIHL